MYRQTHYDVFVEKICIDFRYFLFWFASSSANRREKWKAEIRGQWKNSGKYSRNSISLFTFRLSVEWTLDVDFVWFSRWYAWVNLLVQLDSGGFAVVFVRIFTENQLGEANSAVGRGRGRSKTLTQHSRQTDASKLQITFTESAIWDGNPHQNTLLTTGDDDRLAFKNFEKL